MKGQNTSEEAAFLEAFYRGGEWLAKGDFAEAKLHLEQALRLNPNNEKTQNLLGLTYFKLNLWKDAAQIYEALLRSNPGDATLHINLGLVFLKQNNTRQAVREFETAIALQADNKKAHNYLGLALAQGEEYARASEHFLLAGSDAMASRMNQILEELAKVSRPPLASPHRPVEKEKEASTDNMAPKSKMVKESSAAEASSAAETSNTAEVSSEAETSSEAKASSETEASGTAEASSEAKTSSEANASSEAETSGEAEASSAARASEGEKAGVVSEKEADTAGGVEEANPNSKVEAPAETSSKPVSVLPRRAMPALEISEAGLSKEKEKEDVFPLPSAQKDSKPAERFQPPSTEEALSTGLKISQAVAALPWPKEGTGPFQVDKEVVVISVQGELLTRITGLLGAAGNLDTAPEMRRYRGRPTGSPFGMGQEQVQRLMGSGVLFIEKATTEFLSLTLDDGSLYLREENLFAFEEQLNFENGRLSGDDGGSIDMVHLKGEGKLLLRLKGGLRRIPVSSSMSLRVPVFQLVGWYGQLTPMLSTMVGRNTVVVLSGMGSALISVAGQRL